MQLWFNALKVRYRLLPTRIVNIFWQREQSLFSICTVCSRHYGILPDVSQCASTVKELTG
jgi:hypothetical protein